MRSFAFLPSCGAMARTAVLRLGGLALLLSAALLAGCGGGGEDEEEPHPFPQADCQKNPAACK